MRNDFLRDEEITTRQGSGLSTLAICGDPIVSGILVLLLGDSGYEARFLPPSSLEEPGALKGVRLLLVTPTPQLSTERRKALLASLKDMAGATELLVLELVTPLEERREEEAQDEAWDMVPWPCRIEELEWRIEAALRTKLGDNQSGYIVLPCFEMAHLY